jgi:two-component system response regulator FlrC
MDMSLQAKLLRVLQEREVERLGGRKPIPLDVRVITTSNRIMRDEVLAGRFREDLYYRLNVFPLQLPPLRDRREDIVPLAQRLVALQAGIQGKPVPEFSDAAKQKLMQHVWLGNVRELDNFMQRVLVMHRGSIVEADDLHFESMPATRPDSRSMAHDTDNAAVGMEEETDSLGDDLKSVERNLILDALRAGMGSRKVAAERLGISPRTLRYKLARLREQGVVIPG